MNDYQTFADPDCSTATKGMTCFAGVVKRWECDLNGHMNVQFFLRAFHQASAVCAQALGGASGPKTRIHRFCREIFCPEAYSVETFRLRGGGFDGWIFHRMQSSDRNKVFATAVEPAGPHAMGLPEIAAEGLTHILPRSMTGTAAALGPLTGDVAGLGIILARELDHLGHVPVHDLAGRMAAASHLVFERMGLSQQRIKNDKINRFMLEMRYTAHRAVTVGTQLHALSYLRYQTAEKTFVTEHHLLDGKDATPLASFECLMAIADLETRKLIAMPADMADYARNMSGMAIA